jgi:type IV pilus assembly protein PilP
MRWVSRYWPKARRALARGSFKLGVVLGGAALLHACGDTPPVAPATSAPVKGALPPPGGAKPASPKPPAGATRPANAPPEPARPKIDFQEEDFAETDRSRDPFRSFSDVFAQKGERRNIQRQPVVLEQYALEDLKLVGIVTGIEPARAMLVDPTGQGHVVHRNDLIGRAERVQVGTGAADLEINWRVERIRESDVVLVREDPANPDVPSATRVLALRPEEQK